MTEPINDYHPYIHELKCWPIYYRQLRDGSKPFDMRKDDRNFRVGDLLVQREYDPEAGVYTGYVTVAVITSIVRDTEHLRPGYAALGIRVLR